MQPQFVVVKKQSPYTFIQFHPTLESANGQAEKLARKERVPFMVLAVVGEVRPVDIPVAWERVEGFWPEGAE